mgnify:CR=1 FL=1
MAYHECGCRCKEKVYIPEEFGIGLIELQKKYEKDFITVYNIFKVGHLDKIIKTIEEVNNQNAN